ncbi:MAG: hypothetical protein HXX09_07330 [Bacteroidetes bacterium]|nr:hypothetical protein [Bacteroidota bacterium]
MKHYILKAISFSFLIISLLLFSSCFKKNKNGIQIVEEKYNSPLSLTKFDINPEKIEDSIHGFDFSFKIDFPILSDEPLKKYGANCNTLQFIISIMDEKGNKIKANKSLYDSLCKPFVYEEYTMLDKYDKNIKLFFPYYKNNTLAGVHYFYFLIEAFPISREKDTAKTMTFHTDIIKRLSSTPDMSVKIKFQLNHPEVNKYAIKVDGFELDDTKFDPHSCDVAIFGPGYPDPFWSIYAGQKYIYGSTVFKNILKYDSVYTSCDFYLSDKDKINLYVSDYDSFGRNDGLGFTVIKPNEISHDIKKPTILSFDWVKNFKITAIKK